MQNTDLTDFIKKHRLPDTYARDAQQWFSPVADSIAAERKKAGKTLIIGINGSQGSGKSTLAEYLALLLRGKYHLKTVVLSIDDFYLTLQQRKSLSKSVHPLMVTRGVPGTHDVELAIKVIQGLSEGKSCTEIPRFDKSVDDRYPEGKWDKIFPPTDIIIFEGWCVGADSQSAEELLKPVNSLEKNEDCDGTWRNYVNQQLASRYQDLFKLVNTWIMLKAPSFDCVYQWRLEQETKLRRSLPEPASTTENTKVMDESGVKRFIQYYQRITEHLLNSLPDKVDILFELDQERKILSLQQKNTADV